ncbi:uncharacterized protein TNCV_3355391 [Trichonephila clavipes]|nr:uncharacterized protein TNCV_3355391 [Trichonephila clavipes]
MCEFQPSTAEDTPSRGNQCTLNMSNLRRPLVGVKIRRGKNRWNAGILTITNRSVSNSECGPVCDLKTVAEVLKNRRCYPTTSIRSTRSHNPSPRPISDNKCVASEGQWVRRSQSSQEYEFRDKLFAGDSIMLACTPEDQ